MKNSLARRVLDAQVRLALQDGSKDILKVRRLLREAEHERRELVLLLLQVEHGAVRHEVLHDLQLVLGHGHVQRCPQLPVSLPRRLVTSRL